MATSKPSKVDSVTFPMRPSKAERYQIEREKDAQFAKIPQDLITEYFDLEDEKKGIEIWAEKELSEIKIYFWIRWICITSSLKKGWY
jgi:hypothetical protein